MQEQISLSYETKVINPVGDERSPKVVGGAVYDYKRGACTQTIKKLCPNLTVRLSISPACCNKGLNVCVEERCVFAESNRFVVVVLSD